MANSQERFVNVIPTIRLKKVIESDEEDNVNCRLCSKTFANFKALTNHAKMEHEEAYLSGDPTVWIQPQVKKPTPTKQTKEPQSLQMMQDIKKDVQMKTEQMRSSMQPTSITTLASNDVSYIIIKADELPAKRKKEKESKKVSYVMRREKQKVPPTITGPFECLQPSTLVADGTCHQIFFSCCEYSAHYRDEHNRRRKALRCQVCEKPLQGGDRGQGGACELCGNNFETSKELSVHMCVAHAKPKPFECNICHKRFTQQGGVQQHMRMHTGDRPFPCTFCPKAFTQKSGLDQHLRIHTKIKPYRCVVCGKTFCQSVHLKQHMRTHTNVSPFQCAICEKRFKQSSHLNYHLKNHDPANMTEDQKQKYTELVGLMTKEIVEVEIDQTQTEFQYEVSVDKGFTNVLEGVEAWCADS